MSKATAIRTANIKLTEPGYEFPWNIGLYDVRVPDEYVESVGAKTLSEAIAIADAWVNCNEERFWFLRVHGEQELAK